MFVFNTVLLFHCSIKLIIIATWYDICSAWFLDDMIFQLVHILPFYVISLIFTLKSFLNLLKQILAVFIVADPWALITTIVVKLYSIYSSGWL